jgi:ankyrin repeat protein
MLDGVDEISPFYKDTVFDLLQALRQTAVEQLWVTTRPYLRNELEDKLQQLSYTLKHFSEENQVDFLTKYWSLNSWLTEGNGIVEEEGKKKLQVYAKELIKKLCNSITNKDRQFTGIPLQTRMLAEAFDREVKTFYLSAESMPELEFQLDLLGLYGRFIERKYDIYQEEKCQVPVNNVGTKEQRDRDVKRTRENHQLLALKVLFNEEKVTLFQKRIGCSFSAEELTRIGIVQVSHDGKPHFIHRTFAEYYVADCLVNRLTEGNNISEQELTFILEDVFQKEEYRVIRVFIDGLLSVSGISEQVLKEYGNQIHGLLKDSQPDDNADDDDDEDEDDDNYDEDDYDDDDDDNDVSLCGSLGDSVLLLHRAVHEGNANIIGFLLDSVQAAEDTDTINKLLLEKDEEGRTAWHRAVFSHNIQVSEKLRECAKRNPRAHNFRKNLLFAKDNSEMNAWHLAVKERKIEVLLKQWELAKENLTKQEVNKLLLARDNDGRTVFHLAAKFCYLEVFQRILNWAKENLATENIIKLLIATDNGGMTIFRVAGESGNLGLLEEIMNWVKYNLTIEEVNKLFLATDNEGMRVFHAPWKFYKLEVFQGILNWAKENLTTNEVNKLLLATDNDGRTVLHVAAKFSDQEIFKRIMNLAKEYVTEKVNDLLIATGNEGWTVFHMASRFGEIELLQEILNWVKYNLRREEVNRLFLVTDKEGRTVFHMERKFYKSEVFQGILNWAKANLTREEISKILLTTDNEGGPVFHVAAEFCELEVFQGILNWAIENLTTGEVNTFLLATDKKGRTVFHVARNVYKQELFQRIWL